jgi:hypothetical protein
MNAFELADKVISLEPKREHLIDAAIMLQRQAQEIEYWKDAFSKAMALTEHMKHLESQVYGGTTK